MFCTKCGAKIEDGNSFCPSCGAELRMQPQSGVNARQVRNDWIEAHNGPLEGSGSSGTGGAGAGSSGAGSLKALWIALGFLFLAAVVFLLVFPPEFGDNSNKPYGGAKVKKQTVWDNELVTVTVKGPEDSTGELYYCDCLALTVKNKSSEPIALRGVSMAASGASIQLPLPVAAAQVAPGETVNAELVMENYCLEDMKLHTPGNFTMEFSVTDPGGTRELANSGIVTAETTKKKKADVPAYKMTAKPIYSSGGISIGCEGFHTAGTTMRYGVGFQVENSSGSTVKIKVRDLTLSGLPWDTDCEGFFQTGTSGVFFAWTDFKTLEEIDKTQPVFPIEHVTGTCEICSADGTEQIASFPFEFQK